jgi:hypothetical protein
MVLINQNARTRRCPLPNWALRERAERVVQPTDFRVWSVSVFLGTEAARRNERDTPARMEALVNREAAGRDPMMKDRVVRLLAALTAVAGLALAGGASLRGF